MDWETPAAWATSLLVGRPAGRAAGGAAGGAASLGSLTVPPRALAAPFRACPDLARDGPDPPTG
ncbi:hypothetical protein GCM10023085_29490 [Actinomadura viridis]